MLLSFSSTFRVSFWLFDGKKGYEEFEALNNIEFFWTESTGLIIKIVSCRSSKSCQITELPDFPITSKHEQNIDQPASYHEQGFF